MNAHCLVRLHHMNHHMTSIITGITNRTSHFAAPCPAESLQSRPGCLLSLVQCVVCCTLISPWAFKRCGWGKAQHSRMCSTVDAGIATQASGTSSACKLVVLVVSCLPAQPSFSHDLMVGTGLHCSQLLAGCLLAIGHSLPLLDHSPQPLLGHQVDRPRLKLAVLRHSGIKWLGWRVCGTWWLMTWVGFVTSPPHVAVVSICGAIQQLTHCCSICDAAMLSNHLGYFAGVPQCFILGFHRFAGVFRDCPLSSVP